MTDEVLSDRKKYFNVSWTRVSHNFFTEEEQVSHLGRHCELGDVLEFFDGFVIVGQKINIRLGRYLRIPLEVSSQFENALDVFAHLVRDKICFTIDCATTDKSAMTFAGETPTCYWHKISLVLYKGELYKYDIEYFPDLSSFSYSSIQNETSSEVFDEHCAPWLSMLAVLGEQSRWKTKEVEVHVGSKVLETANYSLKLRWSQSVELHRGLRTQILNLKKHIEDNLKCSHIKLADEGMMYHVVVASGSASTCTVVVKKDEFRERVKQKYFHRVIVDVCMALASYNIPNYEMREIIMLLPGLRHNPDYRMMKTIFAVNESIRKVREQREQRNKNSSKR